MPVPFKITHDQLNQLIDRREYKEIPLGSLVDFPPFSHSLERLDSPRFSGTGNQPWKWKIHPKKSSFQWEIHKCGIYHVWWPEAIPVFFLEPTPNFGSQPMLNGPSILRHSLSKSWFDRGTWFVCYRCLSAVLLAKWCPMVPNGAQWCPMVPRFIVGLDDKQRVKNHHIWGLIWKLGMNLLQTDPISILWQELKYPNFLHRGRAETDVMGSWV